jgi:hypothetical protein
MNRPAKKASKPAKPSRPAIVVTSANSPDVDLVVQALLPLLSSAASVWGARSSTSVSLPARSRSR